jgi:phospholipid/cholesterol/gamma-HCH transport system substrate-binding protein
MKKHASGKIRLGIFISLGIAVFMLGIFYIGAQQHLFESTFRISGIFKDVGGLQIGNNVRFSGINVGTVDNISAVSDSTVKVEIVIEEDTRKFIKKDATASIGSEGLMGNKVLIINPGTGGQAEIENNDTIQTIQPINFDDVLISLKATIDNASNITDDMAKIVGTIQSGKGTIGRLFMDQTLAQNIDSSVLNLKQGSEGMANLMEDLKGSFAENMDSILVNLKEGSEGFKTLTTKAKKSWLLWGF